MCWDPPVGGGGRSPPLPPEHEGYKYFVPAQSEDQRRRRMKHQLAVDQLECSFFYTSYSQKSLLGNVEF